MSNLLTIIARIEAKKESVDFVKEELFKLIKPTREEKGCIQYDLHQDNENKEVFIFVEKWENKSLWEAHMQNRHLKAFVDATEGLLVDLSVNQMRKIED